MTTLITGGGMVGSLAAARLIAEHGESPVILDLGFSIDNLRERLPLDQVTLVRGDVTDLSDLIRTIRTHKVDRIIHTAAFLTWMVRERPYAGGRVNLMGTLSVLEAARLSGVKRVVLCSSGTVYMGIKGAPEGGVLREDFALRSVSESPPGVYAAMKLGAEWLGHSYRADYGIEFVAVRFSGVFGPWHGAPSGGPAQFLQKLIENTWRGELCQFGVHDLAGYQRGIDYVYAADAAQGAVRAALAPDPEAAVFNIAMGKLYSVAEIIATIERVVGREVRLEVVEAGAPTGYDQEAFPYDLSRSRQHLGFQVEFPMEAAIQDYLAWLEKRPVAWVGRTASPHPI